jgi:hypothetical protein
MKRDLSSISRTLDDVKNNDIIYKKAKIQEIFENDPDLLDVLGRIPKIPLNKYADPSNPTEAELAERKRITEYNFKVSKPQIIPFLKVNDIQTEVLNFIMFDISDEKDSYQSDMIKFQYLTVMPLVIEDDMETEYGIMRVDLLSYIIKDLLCWSNDTGLHWKLVSDTFGITDTKYYSRTLKFLVKAPNTNNFSYGIMRNSYES